MRDPQQWSLLPSLLPSCDMLMCGRSRLTWTESYRSHRSPRPSAMNNQSRNRTQSLQNRGSAPSEAPAKKDLNLPGLSRGVSSPALVATGRRWPCSHLGGRAIVRMDDGFYTGTSMDPTSPLSDMGSISLWLTKNIDSSSHGGRLAQTPRSNYPVMALEWLSYTTLRCLLQVSNNVPYPRGTCSHLDLQLAGPTMHVST